MTTEEQTNTQKTDPAKAEAPAAASTQDAAAPSSSEGQGDQRPRRRKKVLGKERRKAPRKQGGERYKPEFDQSVVDIRRVTRVVAGGRRFSFRVTVVIGNRKGKVGVGVGKGIDTALAIEKAVKEAKKHMIQVNTTDAMSVPYDVFAKYEGSHVEIRPAPGKGIVAGSSARTVLDLAGMSDVSAKMQSRSKNKLNNARATIKALARL